MKKKVGKLRPRASTRTGSAGGVGPVAKARLRGFRIGFCFYLDALRPLTRRGAADCIRFANPADPSHRFQRLD